MDDYSRAQIPFAKLGYPLAEAARVCGHFVPEDWMPGKIKQAEPLTLAQEPNDRHRLLTPREAAEFLRVSESWLAKSRMRGDGPLFLKVGRSIRYSRGVLVEWTKLSAALFDERTHLMRAGASEALGKWNLTCRPLRQ